jgi:hypothetical protein
MWALGNSEDKDGLKKLLLESIASEFSEWVWKWPNLK